MQLVGEAYIPLPSSKLSEVSSQVKVSDPIIISLPISLPYIALLVGVCIYIYMCDTMYTNISSIYIYISINISTIYLRIYLPYISTNYICNLSHVSISPPSGAEPWNGVKNARPWRCWRWSGPKGHQNGLVIENPCENEENPCENHGRWEYTPMKMDGLLKIFENGKIPSRNGKSCENDWRCNMDDNWG